MKKVDMIVKAPHFYTMEGDGVGYKADQAMIFAAPRLLGRRAGCLCARNHSAVEGFSSASAGAASTKSLSAGSFSAAGASSTPSGAGFTV